MVQAYGFTPKQSTRRLDVFQGSEGHQHQDLKTHEMLDLSYHMLYFRSILSRDITRKTFLEPADIKS